jgi:autophagy-related protein 17
VRKQRVAALDSVLDSLGSQVVPPDFYNPSPASSLFGSRHGSDDEETQPNDIAGFRPGQSPTETLRAVLRNGVMNGQRQRNRLSDRSQWKTLRDFIHEQAIEDTLDGLEEDRNMLDVGHWLPFQM